MEKKAIMVRRSMSVRGFTLVELSIVLIIVGIVMVPLLQLYQTYLVDQKMRMTRENVHAAVTALSTFSPVRLPCPSDRSVAPGNANYGVGVCNLAIIPNCTGALNQGICKTNGSRNADGVGGIDTIIIGGVPLKTEAGASIKGMKGTTTLDAWNRRLTYAVAFNLVDPAKTDGKNDFKLGVIEAINENLDPTAGVSVPGDAQYVVLSHGFDGAGAFEYSGALHAPCSAVGVDQRENCDNDFRFMQGLGVYEAAGNDYFDDHAYFYIEASGDLWYILPDAANNPSDHINNLNTDNVGIRTTAPAVKLDVNGDITAPTVRANRICNKAGTDCFLTTFFSGPKTCPAGEVLVGYSGGNPTCEKVDLNPYGAFPGVDCHASVAPTYWVRGIMSNGCVICSNGVSDVRLPAGAPCN
jgi:prepilin-type N-terminal cleavage/methylation domain-containing protein